MHANVRQRNPMSTAEPRLRQRGQALIETLVVAIVAVPLVVLVVLLGKYQSIRSSTVAASRSLAFECAARPEACSNSGHRNALAQSLWRHHFEPSGTSVRSGEAAHPVYRGWTDRAGIALIRGPQDLEMALASPRFDAGSGSAVGRAGSIAALPAGASLPVPPAAQQVLQRLAGPSRFGLQTDDGMVDAQVRVHVARNWANASGFLALQPPALTLHANTAILSEAWTASSGRVGAHSIAARVDAGSRLDSARESAIGAGYLGVRTGLGLLGGIGLEPAADRFRFHEADPLVLPRDRIGTP